MGDMVTLYNGVDPSTKREAHWLEVLSSIKDGSLNDEIERIRNIISDKERYREEKKNLPGATFCATFNGHRNKSHVLVPTGFIVADIDHIDNVDELFDIITQDERIWFAFKSPSGAGIKCGLRNKNIKNDEDIKKFFAAISEYFEETYQVKIDKSCKDIARLTFLSSDERCYINDNAIYFDIERWTTRQVYKSKIKSITSSGQETGAKKYAAAVLDSCCNEIRNSFPGNQHRIRLNMSRLIGGYSHYLNDDSMILSRLEEAVESSGAKNMPASMKTIEYGFNNGKISPIYLENLNNEEDWIMDNDENNVSNVSDESIVSCVVGRKQGVSKTEASCKQVVSNGSSVHDEQGRNLRHEIKKWISGNVGIFSIYDIDNEFCLKDRRLKNFRSKILNDLQKEGLIANEGKKTGTWRILNSHCERMDLLSGDSQGFNFPMVFGIDQLVEIHPGNIIIIAGTTNAGKTAYVSTQIHIIQNSLNTEIKNLKNKNLKEENTDLSYRDKAAYVSNDTTKELDHVNDVPEVHYFNSEMSATELRNRLSKHEGGLSAFKNVSFWSRSADFADVIRPNAINVIDYLEVHEDFWRIGAQIAAIHEKLAKGIAIICIQKKKGAEFARGGEFTMEKARLYISLEDNSPYGGICKIVKGKCWKDSTKNPNGLELDYKLIDGCKFIPLSDWRHVDAKQREKINILYSKKENGPKGYAFTFKTKNGKIVGLNHEDFEKWSERFTYLDLTETLSRISHDSDRSPWLAQNWYFQLSAWLEKENNRLKQPEQQMYIFEDQPQTDEVPF